MNRRSHNRGLLLALLLPAASLVHSADWVGPAPDAPARQSLEAMLKAHPLAPGQNIRVIPVQRGPHTAQVLVQVRDREPVHYHDDSDITVFMLRGHGVLHIADKSFPVKAGDVLFVPRRVVHYFVNQSGQPAAALVIYSPPPGPNDRVLLGPANGQR